MKNTAPLNLMLLIAGSSLLASGCVVRVRPAYVGPVWVPHRYVYRNGRHVWVRGGWR